MLKGTTSILLTCGRTPQVPSRADQVITAFGDIQDFFVLFFVLYFLQPVTFIYFDCM